MLLLLFLACQPDPPPPELTVEERFDLAPSASGGFDDWSGAAVAWAIDEEREIALVVAMHYELGVGTHEFAPDDDALDSAQAWEVDVPDAFAQDVADWPILAELVTDAAGARGLPMDFAAVVARGAPDKEPESLWVALDGEAWLRRGEGYDELETDLVLVEVTAWGDGAEVVDPAYGLGVEDVDLSFPAVGSD